MTKEVYLNELTDYLNEEEYQHTNKTIVFYDELITSLLTSGETMDNVISMLGTPQQLSSDLIMDEEEPFILPSLPEDVKPEVTEPESVPVTKEQPESNEDLNSNDKTTSETKAFVKLEKKPNILSRMFSFLFSLFIILPYWLIIGFILFAIVWVLIAVAMSGLASGIIVSTFALLGIGFFLLLLSGTVLLNRIRRYTANLLKGGY